MQAPDSVKPSRARVKKAVTKPAPTAKIKPLPEDFEFNKQTVDANCGMLIIGGFHLRGVYTHGFLERVGKLEFLPEKWSSEYYKALRKAIDLDFTEQERKEIILRHFDGYSLAVATAKISGAHMDSWGQQAATEALLALGGKIVQEYQGQYGTNDRLNIITLTFR